ncbi:MAG: 50S ribosomal protein L37ae [Halobacteriota archaeon]
MAKKRRRGKGKITKSAGRFGARYGRKIRKAVATIEAQTKAAHKCPRCERASVSRIGTGLWKCTRCGFTFAGGTYIPQTSVGITVQRAIKRLTERESGAEIGVEGSGGEDRR